MPGLSSDIQVLAQDRYVVDDVTAPMNQDHVCRRVTAQTQEPTMKRQPAIVEE